MCGLETELAQRAPLAAPCPSVLQNGPGAGPTWGQQACLLTAPATFHLLALARPNLGDVTSLFKHWLPALWAIILLPSREDHSRRWKEHLEHSAASGNSAPAEDVTAGSSLRDRPTKSFPLAIRNPRAVIVPGSSVGRSSSLTPHLLLPPSPQGLPLH